MEKIKAAWIGLGNMGTPMAANLLKAGFEVTIYNRTIGKATPLEQVGGAIAASAAAAAKEGSFVFTMLSDDVAVKQLYLGEGGLLKGNIAGKLFIDMSTVAPATSREVAAAAVAAGASFLDAPVSGSVRPATDGTLIILAGGDAKDFDRAKPLLDKLGRLCLHLGPTGAGSSAKLAINYFLAVTLQGLSETVLFANANGISTQDMLTIVNEGACASGITKLKAPSIISNEFPAAFALKHMDKDIRLAREQGIDTPLAAPLAATYRKAVEEGFGEEDVMAVIKSLQ